MPRSLLTTPALAGLALTLALAAIAQPARAQERQPWETGEPRPIAPFDDRREPGDDRFRSTPLPPPASDPFYRTPTAPRTFAGRGSDDAYRPPQREAIGPTEAYPPGRREPVPYRGEPTPHQPAPAYSAPGYGAPYEPSYGPPPGSSRDAYNAPVPRRYEADQPRDGTFSMREINAAGHGFFGSISQGLASVIEYSFNKKGRPNGYILGEDLGGAFVAGLRYGEGRLHTKDAGNHKVYWQGPSIGYDAGAEGSKVMVLVYNLRDPNEIYQRFGGIAGSAYVIGGVGLTFQSHDHVVLAPIRSGIGLRLGANIGYLKYTRRPTWNPF